MNNAQISEYRAILHGYSPYLITWEYNEAQRSRIIDALKISFVSHYGQFREDKSPYILHPIATSIELNDTFGIHDWKITVAELLHDCDEDTLIDLGILRQLFSNTVAEWVKWSTKPPRGHPARDTYYADVLRLAPWQVHIMRICDRVHNLRTLSCMSKEKQRKKIEETKRWFYPMCDRLLQTMPKKYWHLNTPQHAKTLLQSLCAQYE